jgi:hypothetical protein
MSDDPCPFCDDTLEVVVYVAPGHIPVKAYCSCATILFLDDNDD